jgi:hypothetical protein
MSVTYICRHCRSVVGTIDNPAVSEARLGFDSLTPEERNDIITYNPDGNVEVKTVCDYCKEALDTNPELNLVVSPLQ